jgi:5,5'-dehydrodivanillate O-demethylase
MLRNLLRENLERMQRGEDPMNVFRDPTSNVCIDLPVENQTYRFGGSMRLGLAGQADKFSPILKEAGLQDPALTGRVR